MTTNYEKAKEIQESMHRKWGVMKKDTEDVLGVRGSEWFTWTRNGGGEWVMPKKISRESAAKWLTKTYGMGADGAINTIANADIEKTKGDVIKEIGQHIWSNERCSAHVYSVNDLIYTINRDDAEVVSAEDAIEFVATFYREDQNCQHEE